MAKISAPPPTFTAFFKGVQLTPLTQNGYNIIILDSSGTLTFPSAGKDNVYYYVVGGGGGGGKGRTSGAKWGGNGGNGGVISTGTFNIPSDSTYNIVIGDGGFGFGQPYSITAAYPATVGNRTNYGGVTSIRGPSLDVSCNGGFVGTTPTSARTSNTRQSIFGLGGNGGLSDVSGNQATNGEDGMVFPPNNTYYGAGGGGGVQYGYTPGNGGQTGGGNGSMTTRITVGGVNTGIGFNYGAGGGGTGGRDGSSLTGNAGFKGCVFLYWQS